MSLDPNKTYLVWRGTEFPNSTSAQFKAPAGSTIDWGDGTDPETFDTASTSTPSHIYQDGRTEHTIAISGLTSIGNYASFSGCTSLTSIKIGNRVTSIGPSAFAHCNSLTSVTIPNSVKTIGPSAFRDCISLTSVTIPNSVKTISPSAFQNCSSLMSVTIPNSVITIDSSAFAYCTSLTSVTIPDSVTSIDPYVFANCSSLKQLILFPSTPPNLSSNAIPSTISKIYVQQSSKATYQAAEDWVAYKTKIVSDNIYLSLAQFNQKNKEYIDGKIGVLSTATNLENGKGDVLIQTTDSNQSFKVMTDGRAKVYGEPTESNDVLRWQEKLALETKINNFISNIFTETNRVDFIESDLFGTGLQFSEAGIYRVKATYNYGSESGTDILIFSVSETFNVSDGYKRNYEIKVLKNGNNVQATSDRQGGGTSTSDQIQWIYLKMGIHGTSTQVTNWKYEKLNLADLGTIS